MPELPDILTVFQEQVSLDAVDPHARLGESLDDLLGFSREAARNPDVDMPEASPASWRRDPSNYGSITEYRLQAFSESMLSFARDDFKLDSLPQPDSICVRIVEREHGSPSSRTVGGYHYIQVPSGFIKSLESLWRVQSSLAERGKKFAATATEIRSDRIGGASVERSLTNDFRHAWGDLDSVFFDVGWHRWFHGSMVFPEEVLAAGARATEEFLHGMYSTEDKPASEFRLPSTQQSRWLTRLVLAYVLAHEIGHCILNHGGTDSGVNERWVETWCDSLATTYFPLFVERHSKGWELALDGGTERVAGIHGFFAAVQIRYTIGLILGLSLKETSQGSAIYDAISARMTELGERAMNQAGLLSNMASGDIEPRTFVIDILTEFQALLVGVQMVGMRRLTHRQTSFVSHFSRWENEFQDHLEEMARRRHARTPDESKGRQAMTD